MSSPIRLTDIVVNDGMCAECRVLPISEEASWAGTGDFMCESCRREHIVLEARKAGLLLSIEDLRSIRPAKPLIRKTIMQREVTVLVGPPGAGKSFLALDWALSIASHRQKWQGRAVTERCPVLYVTNEGAAGLEKRVRAWRKSWGSERDELFSIHIPSEPLWDRTKSQPNLEDVIVLARALGAKLVVFDTLSSLFGGIQENGAEDVAMITNRLAAMRNEHDIASLLIHHSPKSNPEDARGSGALKGNTDAMIVMSGNGSTATIKTVKVKDDAGWSMDVQLSRVDLGSDDEGYPVSSLILQRAERAGTDLKQRVLGAIPAQPEVVTSNQVLKALGLEDSARTQVTRAISGLVSDGLVVSTGKRGRSPLYALTVPDGSLKDETDPEGGPIGGYED